MIRICGVFKIWSQNGLNGWSNGQTYRNRAVFRPVCNFLIGHGLNFQTVGKKT
jgi:hypothetical protein